MDRRRIDDELATPGAWELLGSPSAAHLAYLASDGTPRLAPVGFYWTGEHVVIATASIAPKVAALTAHPAVAVSIDSGDTPEPARAPSIRGEASVEIIDGVVPEYLAAARKGMDADAAAAFDENVRGFYRRIARIAIPPTWVRYYDFGAGRLPRFLQELGEQNRS